MSSIGSSSDIEEYVDYVKVAPSQCFCYKCQISIFSEDCPHWEGYYIEGVVKKDEC